MIDGILLIDRALFRNPLWLRDKPFSEGAAWLDLLGLVNQTRATYKTANGRVVNLDAGQLGWSIVGLADRWGWGRNPVGKTLERWKREGRIEVESDNTTTIITVLNFRDYQAFMVGELCNRKTTDGATGVQQACNNEARIGKGIGITEGTSTGKGIGSSGDTPTLDSVFAWFETNDSRYSRQDIEAAWWSYEAGKDPETGRWRWGRGFVSDWRAAMCARLARTFVEGEKNGAQPQAGNWQSQRLLRERLAVAREEYEALSSTLGEQHEETEAAWGRVRALEAKQDEVLV